MKKIFSLFAAVLMAGSMMADDDATLIKFEEVQTATQVAGSTYGSNGFTLVVPTESDKATVDANNCTFGLSAEETVSFTHRLKTGGASSKDGRKFTLNIPEEGPLAIYARTSSKDATDRSFFITNGNDTIVNHTCLDTDTVEGASSKIFLPVFVENVPAGSYTITYNNGINFYGFQMVVEEEPVADRYIKGSFVDNAWTWTLMSYNAANSTYSYQAIAAEKNGVNINDRAENDGSAWFAADQISGDDYIAGDTVTFTYNPATESVSVTRDMVTPLPDPTLADRYIKGAWAGADTWTWKAMTPSADRTSWSYSARMGEYNGVNINDRAADAGSAWFAPADLLGDTFEAGDSVLFVYDVYLKTVTASVIPAGAWDGTVTLSKESFAALSELEGMTLTFNGATTLALLDAEGSMIALQNEDGGEMYALWAPAYGGTYTINGTVVTLNGWYAAEGETDALPAESATLYVEDYGSFIVDGDEEATFETAEIAYVTAGPTTYTVTYTVTGFDAEHCLIQAGYFNDSEEGDSFVAGANTVPENMSAFVYVMTVDGYTVEVKVNGEAVTLADGYWDGAINADMTIDVTFTAPEPEPEPLTTIVDTLKYSKFVRDDASATSYQNYTYVSTSGATYKAHMMYQATDDKIQLRSTQTASTYYSGIVNTVAPAGKYIKSVSVEWEASTADARQLNIFTVDAPIAINDMFASGATPNYTSVKSAGDKTFNVSGEHAYLGVCSQAGAMYLKSIVIEWAVKPTPTAVENVEAVKAVKVIENGQVVIIREGVRYNVAGQKL